MLISIVLREKLIVWGERWKGFLCLAEWLHAVSSIKCVFSAPNLYLMIMCSSWNISRDKAHVNALAFSYYLWLLHIIAFDPFRVFILVERDNKVMQSLMLFQTYFPYMKKILSSVHFIRGIVKVEQDWRDW